MIDHEGVKYPSDWHSYALKLERFILDKFNIEDVKSVKDILDKLGKCTIQEDADLDDDENWYFKWTDVVTAMEKYALLQKEALLSKTKELQEENERLKKENKNIVHHLKVMLAASDGELDANRMEYGESYPESEFSIKAKEFLKSLMKDNE